MQLEDLLPGSDYDSIELMINDRVSFCLTKVWSLLGLVRPTSSYISPRITSQRSGGKAEVARWGRERSRKAHHLD